MFVDWKDSPTVQLVEALLDDEESREAYKDTCVQQIRKRIDPEYDHFELAVQADGMAVSYGALTEHYIRFAARLIEQAAIYGDPNYDDDKSSLSIPSSYTDPVELRELITRIWMPLPGYEVSDFVWLEVLYAALLSNHVVQLIDGDYRRKRNLGTEQARLDFVRSQTVEPLLGTLTQRLLSSFDRTFLTKRDLRGIDVVGTRLVTRERATGSSWSREALDWLAEFGEIPGQLLAGTLFESGNANDPAVITFHDWFALKNETRNQQEAPSNTGTDLSEVTEEQPHEPYSNRQVAPDQSGRCIVWFATNRVEARGINRRMLYKNKPDDTEVHYGRCTLELTPGNRTRGGLISQRNIKLRTVTRPLTAATLHDEINNYLDGLPDSERNVLVFVHGYRTSFREAMISAAQLAFHLQFRGVITCFSWPSVGSGPFSVARTVPIMGYHRDAIRSRDSRHIIADFLTNLLQVDCAQSIDVVAHSMGCLALADAIESVSWPIIGHPSLDPSVAQRGFGQILLAAPDIRTGTFNRTYADLFGSHALRTTMYVSRKDYALMASKMLNGAPSVGLTPPITVASNPADRIDTLDASNVNPNWFGVGHSYYADSKYVCEDMSSVIRTGAEPKHRRHLYSARNNNGQRYWLITRWLLPHRLFRRPSPS